MSDRIARLIDAHLRHELANWHGDALQHTLTAQLRAFFQWCSEVKLDDVITRGQINQVIERYVIELRVSGGITELSGEMSRVVFGSEASRETRVAEVLAPDSYEEFADKVLALDRVRRELIAQIARSATFANISARMLARGILDLFAPPLALERGAWIEGMGELLGRLGARLLPPLERRLAEALGRYIEKNRERLVRDTERHLLDVLEPERLRSVVDELWDGLSSLRLSEAFALVGEQDIEDFVVLVYEFWLRYRKTEFFRRISSEMVDHFFGKYGQESLLSLMEDMGVTEAMVIEELTGLLRPILDHAARSGFLERQIRQRLEGFYRSPAFAALLESSG